jgi:hypothetical protein
MTSLKHREDRQRTFLRARMRSDSGWSDVTIGNVSSRGLMLQCTTPLRRNCFIEVQHREVCIVGRVVWSSDTRCGVRTQDAVDLSELLAQAPPRLRRAGEERRKRSRRLESLRVHPGEVAEASKRFARAFDWTVMILAAGVAGVVMAHTAWTVLEEPVAQVGTALAGNG